MTKPLTKPLYPPHSIDEPSSDDSAAAGAAAAWNAFAALVACRTRLPWLLALAELSVLQQLLLQAVHVAGALGAERPNKAWFGLRRLVRERAYGACRKGSRRAAVAVTEEREGAPAIGGQREGASTRRLSPQPQGARGLLPQRHQLLALHTLLAALSRGRLRRLRSSRVCC